MLLLSCPKMRHECHNMSDIRFIVRCSNNQRDTTYTQQLIAVLCNYCHALCTGKIMMPQKPITATVLTSGQWTDMPLFFCHLEQVTKKPPSEDSQDALGRTKLWLSLGWLITLYCTGKYITNTSDTVTAKTHVHREKWRIKNTWTRLPSNLRHNHPQMCAFSYRDLLPVT